MRKTVLSRRQQAILLSLYSYSQSNGFYPTFHEICEREPDEFNILREILF